MPLGISPQVHDGGIAQANLARSFGAHERKNSVNGFVGFLKTETDSGSTSKAKGSSSQSKGNVDRSSYADQDDAVADDARTPLQSQTPADDDVRPDDSQVDTQHIEDQTEVAVSAEFEEPDASQKQNGSEPTDNRDETDDDAVDAAELVAQLVVTDTNAQRIEITGDLKTEDAQEPASDALEIDSESSAQAVNDAVLSTTPATDAATASNAQLADTQTVAVQNVIDVKSKDVHRSSDVHATKVREPSKQVDAKIQADVPATTADSEQSISTHDVKDAATRNIQSETQKPADQSVTDAKPQTNPVTDVQAESVVETRTPSEESSSKPTDKDSRDKATKVANFILQRSEPGDSAASARAEQINAQIALENATDVKSDSKSVNADANGVQVDSLLRAVSMKGSHATAEGGSGLTSNSGNTQNDTSLTNQVVRGMNAIVNQRGGVMTLRLSPPELGDIRIQMTLTQGNVAADLRASTPQAQEALERHLTTLQRSLENHGLNVERLTVSTSGTSGSHMGFGQGDQQQSGSDLKQDANAGQGQSRGRGGQQDGQQSFAQQEQQQREQQQRENSKILNSNARSAATRRNRPELARTN